MNWEPGTDFSFLERFFILFRSSMSRSSFVRPGCASFYKKKKEKN